MAPNTAMLTRTPPINAPATWPSILNQTTSITPKPIKASVTIAIFEVLCWPWVRERKCGE
jgi:hypothetical protein